GAVPGRCQPAPSRAGRTDRGSARRPAASALSALTGPPRCVTKSSNNNLLASAPTRCRKKLLSGYANGLGTTDPELPASDDDPRHEQAARVTSAACRTHTVSARSRNATRKNCTLRSICLPRSPDGTDATPAPFQAAGTKLSLDVDDPVHQAREIPGRQNATM